MSIQAQDILHFWFEELSPEDHFKKSPQLDARIKERFLKTLESAAAGELWSWRQTAEGSLAEIIVLDQFSRNIFRGDARSFAQDTLALALVQTAIDKGYDKELETNQKSFMYMPFMHSESLAVHELAVKLFDQKGLEFSLKFEIAHKKIIEQFGRYPHRNAVLGRKNSAAEEIFLKEKPNGF